MNWPEAYAYLQSCPPSKVKEQLLRLAMGKCRVKPVRARIRLPRGQKPKSIKALKKDAWDAFSRFIRQRDADENGNVKCCTCENVRHWKGMQAGHFVSRVQESTLFDEMNVWSQCAGCNMPPNNGRPFEYAAFLDAKFGPGTAEKIRARAHRQTLRRDDLERILKKYSQGKVSEPSPPEPIGRNPLRPYNRFEIAPGMKTFRDLTA